MTIMFPPCFLQYCVPIYFFPFCTSLIPAEVRSCSTSLSLQCLRGLFPFFPLHPSKTYFFPPLSLMKELLLSIPPNHPSTLETFLRFSPHYYPSLRHSFPPFLTVALPTVFPSHYKHSGPYYCHPHRTIAQLYLTTPSQEHTPPSSLTPSQA